MSWSLDSCCALHPSGGHIFSCMVWFHVGFQGHVMLRLAQCKVRHICMVCFVPPDVARLPLLSSFIA